MHLCFKLTRDSDNEGNTVAVISTKLSPKLRLKQFTDLQTHVQGQEEVSSQCERCAPTVPFGVKRLRPAL